VFSRYFKKLSHLLLYTPLDSSKNAHLVVSHRRSREHQTLQTANFLHFANNTSKIKFRPPAPKGKYLTK
jgi:hypothetical protein